MNGPIDGLLSTLHLTDTGARTTEDIFTGPSQWMPLGRVFGGQVLAQSLVAAMHTVPEDRVIHSMHGYFLRPGDVQHPITFSVDRIYDGRSFTTRRTQAYQHGEPILSLIASFQLGNGGLDHQLDMPDGLPEPESLPTTADVLGELDHDVARYWSNERAFDVRHIPSPLYLHVEGDHVPHQAVWMKAFGRLSDDLNQHRAALAYASDY
jgi:acyl-CoA thioesterase-2